MSEKIIPENTEKPNFIIRRHWIIYPFLGFLVLGTLSILSLLFLAKNHLIPIISAPIFWGIMSIFFLLCWLLIVTFWVGWQLNILLVFPDKFQIIRKISPLNQEISTIPFAHIQEIQSETSGIFATIFHYGTIHIFTANSQSKITLPYIHKPHETIQLLKKTILLSQNNH